MGSYEEEESSINAAAIVMASAVCAAAQKLGFISDASEDFTDDEYQLAIDLLIDSDILLTQYDNGVLYQFTDEVGHELEQKIRSQELTTFDELHTRFMEILDAKA